VTRYTLTYSNLYDGDNEFVLDNSGNMMESRTFVYAPTGVCADYVKNASNISAMHYIHTDYLGSWLEITGQDGTSEYSFS